MREPRIIDGIPWYLWNENPAKNEPMKVQLEALRRSKGRRGFNWWMDVGLGKTTTALNEFEHDRRRGVVDFLAVVTLQSFKYSWPIEAEEFGLDINFRVWPDLDPSGKSNKPVTGGVWNWESIIGSGGNSLEKVLNDRKVYLVLDESHRAKNYQSKVTKRLKDLWKESVARRGMTGTPMSLSVMDLYPAFRLAGGLEGVNPIVFRNRYAKMGGFMGKKVTGIRDDMLDEFMELRDKHAFRAQKSEWLPDLPERSWKTLPVRMPEILQKHYNRMLNDFLVELENTQEITASMVMAQMTKLQQITSGFIYDAQGVPHELMPPNMVPKFQAAADVFESLGDDSKLIIFCHFKPTVERMIKFFADLGKPVCVMRGGMDAMQQNAVKAEFNSDTGAPILITQAVVAGAAHTLLGGPRKPCFSSYFAENNYNWLEREQAEGRTHRAGQKYPVGYYDSVSSPIELGAIKSLQDKTNLVEAVVNAVRKGASGLFR